MKTLLSTILLLTNLIFADIKQQDLETIILSEKNGTILFTHQDKEMTQIELMKFLSKKENLNKDFYLQAKGHKNKIKLSQFLSALTQSKIPYKKEHEIVECVNSLHKFTHNGKGKEGSPTFYKKSNKHKVTLTIYGIVDMSLIKSFVNHIKKEQIKSSWITIDITFYEKENFVQVNNNLRKRADEKVLYQISLKVPDNL